MPRKKRHSNHIIEDKSKRILQGAIPETWALHEYGPDYGIDYVIEAFQMRSNSSDASSNYSVETLGEIIFVQLKGMNRIDLEPNKHIVRGRSNIEIQPLQQNKSDKIAIDTIPYILETSELLTIQSMGSAVPVMLMVAIIETNDLYFVCLNDSTFALLIRNLIRIRHPSDDRLRVLVPA